MPAVLQDWVQDLKFMQQSVLISSIRGPDGLHKEHIAKYVLRWLRRCVLISSFDGSVFKSPTQLGGGSFTGPLKSYGSDDSTLDYCFKEYVRCLDEVPHHFHLHLMHAAEILGFKHPDEGIRKGWDRFYRLLVSDMHLNPEGLEMMEYRLGDKENQWRVSEAVPAADIPKVRE